MPFSFLKPRNDSTPQPEDAGAKGASALRGMGLEEQLKKLRPKPRSEGLRAASGAGQGLARAAHSALLTTKLRPVVDALVKLIPKANQERAREHLPIILRQCIETGLTDPRQVAYVVATADHESKFGQARYSRSKPLVEDRNPISRRDGRYTGTVHTHGGSITAPNADAAETAYWDSAYGGMLGNRKGTTDGRRYRGRGYVQLTGRSNYASMTEKLTAEGFTYECDGKTWGTAENPIDLTKHPTHVNRVPELAARILAMGSRDGSFTGVGLDDYINEDGADYRNARRVINGTDQAASIADLAKRYETPLVKLWPSVAARDGGAAGPE